MCKCLVKYLFEPQMHAIYNNRQGLVLDFWRVGLPQGRGFEFQRSVLLTVKTAQTTAFLAQ
jgi:hypothetical protein